MRFLMRLLTVFTLYTDNLQVFREGTLSKRRSSDTYKDVHCGIPFRQKSEFKMFRLIVIFCLIVHVCATEAHWKGYRPLCRYWCRTIDHQYYCCPSGKAESWAEYIWYSFLHPWLLMITVEFAPIDTFWPENVHEEETGEHCPPLRTHCLRTYDWYSLPPTSCHGDEDCDKWEKCCYDVCLEHKTCKHAE
ncbi:uncharacterized protein LOC117232746 [Bombus vosnesenskii]|uniref:Uncharacterized protein LOC117232746 n=1 Tax=Bombus vosnesenskii TaxID=207650 RepID=A0A6J3K574_9HYME|nr:uncharacterized protein LOC117232746 [Bombus vosnesenskii]